MTVLFHCPDRVGADMAGPAIRAVELARRLAARHRVAVVAPGAGALRGEAFSPVELTRRAIRESVRTADVLVTHGLELPLDVVLGFRGRLVLDLYDPVQLEQLARMPLEPSAGERISLLHVRARLRLLLARADHVLCASAAQRAWWLGWLGAYGRLTPEALAGDPEARRLVAVVPFGIPDEPPARAGSPLREAVGAPPEDRVALYWGGMWDWMDPALAVRAAAQVLDVRRDLRLAFVAARPAAQAIQRGSDEARRAARELRVEDRVHFLERWVPYGERGAWLLDADLAVAAHRPSLEAELAFRTRLLDCIWARLPVAATRGDVLAAEGERDGFAALAEPGHAEALAGAMRALLEPAANRRAREAAARAAARYSWEASATTLLDLVASPPPPRPAFAVPGELAGEKPLEIARAFAAKLAGRLGLRDR